MWGGYLLQAVAQYSQDAGHGLAATQTPAHGRTYMSPGILVQAPRKLPGSASELQTRGISSSPRVRQWVRMGQFRQQPVTT